MPPTNRNQVLPPLPELLAPAGTPACALAACDAGADAVYAGLSKFNARERGENFTPDTLDRVIRYFHEHGRKVYVTVNTLIKENELPEMMEMLAALDGMAPDALLIQDLGVLRLARTYFPKLVLHASTQMGFHNSAGLALARRLGFKRVVLERQLTAEELQSMRVPEGLELECFIHGALCCSLSGRCLFSSWLGGASGNRGKCKQPCRRRYYTKEGNGFFFSPGDLAGIEVLPLLRRLGIASLKIEGRLRQSDYVANVVTAYRLLLDATDETQFRERVGEARALLARTCGRRWNSGFYPGSSAFRELIRADAVGAAGMRCGEVEARRANGFGFTPTKRIHLGDRLRIQPRSGDEGPALTVTKMFSNNRPVRTAPPGERLFICCDKEVPDRGIVFKIGESAADYSARVAALPPRRPSVDLKISLNAKELRVEFPRLPLPPWRTPLELATADRSAVDAATLREEFAATGGREFRLGEFEAAIDGRLFFPAKILKSVRRAFWEETAPKLSPEMLRPEGGSAALTQFYFDYKAQQHPEFPERLPETVAVRAGGEEPANRNARRSRFLAEADKASDEAIMPDFIPEARIDAVKRALDRARGLGIRRFRATSPESLMLLLEAAEDDPSIEIVTGTPLPVCNSQAAIELASLGVRRAMAHIELERSAVEALRDHSPLPIELYRWGRPALLTTRAEIPVQGVFKDSRGNAFEVRRSGDGLFRIYPEAVFSVPRIPGVSDFYDLTHAGWKSARQSSFNFEGGLA